MSKSVIRLLSSFVPEHYTLQLNPDRDTLTFTGTVVIEGQKKKPSERFTFHANGLTVTSATIEKIDKKNPGIITVSRINHQKSADEVRLHVEDVAYPGSYKVTMVFEGVITHHMNGIYPCSFEHDGKEKKLIATQFESHHAREAFPCIDEPEAKATFDLTLYSPLGEAVVANTPAVKQSEEEGRLVSTFATTPKMSTYLLAFVFGELQSSEAKTKDGVTVRTWATPDNANFTGFALDTAVKCLDFYNDYFGIPYPLDKCDMIALPDFASGAMENWGCVTYRESCMLVDPDNTSLPTKQYVAMVVAHELAHQWFGNLVTMRWWTDLWLNEGFASWIEYLAVDAIFPEWHMWTQFHADEVARALDLDSLENTHSVEVPIPNPEEIRTIFDNISYAKGASVIHMLHEYMGAEKFRDGLRHYLKIHKYGNTDTDDLWSALEETSKMPIKALMSGWTRQPGFPVLNATFTDKTLTVTQERYVLNPRARQRSTFDEQWLVPLLPAFSISGDPLLQKKSQSWNIQGKPEIPKINLGQSGFYRTVYDESTNDALVALMATDKMAVLDKVGLLGDGFVAALAGFGTATTTLKLIESLKTEENAVLWETAAGHIGTIRRVLGDDEVRKLLRPYVKDLVAQQVDRLGWEEKAHEPYFDSILRPLILGLASFGDNQAVSDEAIRRFNAATKPEDLHPDLRGIIYGTAVRHGSQAEFDKLLDFYKTTASAEEKITLCSALTGFEQPKLIKTALALITTDAVRLQDVTYWIAYSFSNRHGYRIAWQWMQDNWQWLKDNLESDMTFSRLPFYAARSFMTDKDLQEYTNFFASVETPALTRTISQGKEVIEWQSEWYNKDYQPVLNYLTEWNKRS